MHCPGRTGGHARGLGCHSQQPEAGRATRQGPNPKYVAEMSFTACSSIVLGRISGNLWGEFRTPARKVSSAHPGEGWYGEGST